MPRFWSLVLPIALLLIAIFLVFFQTAKADFVGWDDPLMVWQNPGLNPPSWSKTGEFWRRPASKLYTPLAYTIWSAVAAAEHRPEGQILNPAPFHVLNLLLHMAASVLAFLLLRQLVEQTWAAWAGAMLFAIHPLQVEPVAWVAGMNNLLYGALGLAALWQYVLYAKNRGHARRHLVLAALFYSASLLAKPTAVVVPLIAAALDLWVLRRPLKGVVKPIGVAMVMAIPIAIVARFAQPPDPLIVAPPIWARGWVAIDAIGFYVGKLLVPINLALDYERTPRWLMAHPGAAWPGVVAVIAAIIAWVAIPRARAGVAIVPLGLLPVLGLTPFEFQDLSTVGDRYMYLPMLGAALLVAMAMSRAKRLWAWVGAGAVFVLLGMTSFHQAAIWHDTDSLAAHQLAFDPDSATGHKILGLRLFYSHPQEAEAHFRAAIDRVNRDGTPGNGIIWIEYGNLLWQEGRSDEAAEVYQEAIPRMPPENRAMAYDNLGLAYEKLGDPAQARQQFQMALSFDPNDPDAIKHLKGK